MQSITRGAALAAVLVVALFALPAVLPTPATAHHLPADKVAAHSASVEIMSTPLVEGSSSEEFVLMSGLLRTSTPTDLIIQLTLECALWTEIVTVGNDESDAFASVKVWVEFDGEPVLVGEGDEDGKVTFCDRGHRMKTLDFDDEDARIEQYLRTRTANAFNWIQMNTDNGIHEIVVKAQIDAEVTGTGQAYGAIGKRTFVVEPVKMAH